MVLLFVRLVAIFISVNIHAYYVSVSEIYHNPKNNSLEISMKIFIDDLELAIRKIENSEFTLSDQGAGADTKKSMEAYLSDKFQIEINEQPVDMHMIGYELEDDAVLCYIEIIKVQEINTINIENTILCEIYEEQINLTHFQYKGQLKSLKTTKSAPSGAIDASDW
jgi:hypothetical protein